MLRKNDRDESIVSYVVGGVTNFIKKIGNTVFSQNEEEQEEEKPKVHRGVFKKSRAYEEDSGKDSS